MKLLEMSEAIGPLGEYAKEVDKEPLILTKDGKPIAALVLVENADLETVTLSMDPRFLAVIERSRVRQGAGEGISSAEMRRKLGV